MFTENNHNGTIYMSSSAIETIHGFSTRYGGVSEGHLSSLNLGENRGDEPVNVRENYRRINQALGIEGRPMVFSRQVHGNNVQVVTSEDARELYTQPTFVADGLVTTERGLALVVFTADCVPVLLCDSKNGVIGAVHCGWRSSVSGILYSAISKMIELGAERNQIHAAIGPSIGACCFEVGEDVMLAMHKWLGKACYEHMKKISGEPNKYLCDLRAALRTELLAAKLNDKNINVSSECTMCSSDKYWSHRATNGERGSLAAIITQ